MSTVHSCRILYISCDEKFFLIIAVFLRKPLQKAITSSLRSSHVMRKGISLSRKIVVNDESEVRFYRSRVDDIKLPYRRGFHRVYSRRYIQERLILLNLSYIPYGRPMKVMTPISTRAERRIIREDNFAAI